MTVDVLDRAFHALADPTRRAILERLRTGGAASVTTLAEPFTLTPRAVSKHIAVLREAGLVSQTSDAQRRISVIRAEPLEAVDGWLADFRELWERRFDALDEDLRRDDTEVEAR